MRSPTANLYNDRLYIVGGCRAKQDHIADVQVLDLKSQNQSWSIHQSLKLNQARSCHMSALFGNTLYIMGGWNGFDCLNSIEKADLSQIEPKFTQLEKGQNL